MEVKVVSGDILSMESPCLVLGTYEGVSHLEGDVAAADRGLGGAISQLIAQGEVKGKTGEVTLLHTLGKLPAARVAVVGLGKAADLTADKVRAAAADLCRFLRQRGVIQAASGLLGAGDRVNEVTCIQAMTEGALLGTYSFRKHMTKEPGYPEFQELRLVARGDISAMERAAERGRIISEATNYTRDMVNEPANIMTPTRMAEIAADMAREHGLGFEVFDRDRMREMGMGALLAVAQGSQQPPKFIVLRYNGAGGGDLHLVMVGKGITFDSGGISIKPSEGMGEMKDDMSGGAAVMSALSAIARLKLRINCAAIVPATENLPDGNAYKPGDILKAMTGKTIEVISTDAEGRLILSDALGYAVKLGAKNIVDVATLTGACRIALGNICTGAFGNNQDLINRVIAAGNEAGELIWQMPMFEEYKEQNKSDVADIQNTGGRYAGAITAAQFLAEFIDSTPWVHLDIAGTAQTEKERSYRVKGATGVPVRTLVNLALAMSAQQ